MLLGSEVHSVALRALEPSGLHGQGDTLAALHQIGEQPPSKAQKHLHDASNTIMLQDDRGRHMSPTISTQLLFSIWPG